MEANTLTLTPPLENNLSNQELVKADNNIGSENTSANVNPDVNQNQADSDTVAKIRTEKNSILINKIVVEGYELLSDSDINAITSQYEGKRLTQEDFNQLVDDINYIYVKYGIVTARAFLPSQDIIDNTIKVTIVEGRIGKINVEGNKHTHDFYIKNVLTQKEGDIIYLPEVSEELIKFNKNNDIKLKAVVNKGQEFGTSDLTIKVYEPNPYHLGLSFDNVGRDIIGMLKGGAYIKHDSLLGFRDQFIANYNRTKSFNSVASIYSFPVGYSGLRLGGLFGYDGMYISSGPFKDIVEGKTFTYSVFASKPIISKEKFSLDSSISANYKNSTMYLFGRPRKEIDGTPSTEVSSTAFSLSAVKEDDSGQWIASSDFGVGIPVNNNTESFFKYSGNLYRIQRLAEEYLLILRAGGQLSANQLVPLEQFGVGGTSSVRGYTEGYLLGDNGYILSSELRYPLIFLPKKLGNISIRDRFQGVAFAEMGAAYENNVDDSNSTLASVGLGVRFRFSKYLSGKVDYGFALLNKSSDIPTAKLHFGLETAPF